jgi:hypothetical protein
MTAGGSPGPGSAGEMRMAEDDPDSDLYAESSDVDTVISYIMAHT